MSFQKSKGKKKSMKKKEAKEENDKPMCTLHMGFLIQFFRLFLSNKIFLVGSGRKHPNPINFLSFNFSNQTLTNTIFFTLFSPPFSTPLKSPLPNGFKRVKERKGEEKEGVSFLLFGCFNFNF